MSGTPGEAGFTLVEALVAMAILAVAATGLLRATAEHLDVAAALEARLAAGLAAENALAAARLGLHPAAATGRWSTGIAARPSADPAVTALTVTVRDGGIAVALRGFAPAGAAPGEAPSDSGARTDAEGPAR